MGGAKLRTRRDALRDGVRALLQAGVPDAALDAEWMLADLLDLDRGGLFARGGEPVGEETERTFRERIERRSAREPLQHILGRQEFYGRDLVCDPRALVPRQETKTLVDCVLRLRLPDSARLIDLGTGSGCILLTLLAERPDWYGLGIDRSTEALDLARENAKRLHVEERAVFGDEDFGVPVERWSEDLRAWAEQADAIVSNPPYIREGEWEELQPEVRDHDPRQALVSGMTGLEAYRRILQGAGALLKPGGYLLLELGFGQAAAVEGMARQAGWSAIKIAPDLRAIDRVLIARWKPTE